MSSKQAMPWSGRFKLASLPDSWTKRSPTADRFLKVMGDSR